MSGPRPWRLLLPARTTTALPLIDLDTLIHALPMNSGAPNGPTPYTTYVD